MKGYILGGILIAFIVLFILVSKIFPICHSSEIDKIVNINVPTFSEDGTKIGFIAIKSLFRKPVGICKFPDGGKNKYLSRELRVYSVSADGKNPTLITTIPYEDGFNWGTGFQSGMTQNEKILSLTDRSALIIFNDNSRNVLTYNINIADGKYKVVKDLEHDKKNLLWSSYSLNPQNKNVRTSYNQQGIEVYNTSSNLRKIILPHTFIDEI